jgi:hypothetical protein
VIEPDREATVLGALVLIVTGHGGPWICRLCDVNACGRAAGHCPAANAAAEYGQP